MPNGKLTELEFMLLNALIVTGPIHPYALGKAVEERGASGLVSLGALYKALHRLEEEGLVQSDLEEADPRELKRPRRRTYRVTGETEAAVRKAERVRAAFYPTRAGGLAWER